MSGERAAQVERGLVCGAHDPAMHRGQRRARG